MSSDNEAEVVLPLLERSHLVYRFFDAEGSLLYVGCTNDLKTRLTAHRWQQPWFSSVANITTEEFPDRLSALAAEKEAIQTEGPKHNAKHNPFWRRIGPPHSHSRNLHIHAEPELLRLPHLVSADLGRPLSLAAADILTAGCKEHLKRAGLGDLITKEGKD